MRKLFSLGLLVFLAGSFSTVSAKQSLSNAMPRKHPRMAISAPGMRLKAPAKADADATELLLGKRNIKRISDYNPVSTLSAAGYGYLTGSDGTQWYYTQDFELRGSGYSATYDKSVIKLYNSSNEKVGEVEVDIPDDENVNYIAINGSVTKKLFDRDESSDEIVVMYHIVGDASNDYQGAYKTLIYHTTGEKLLEYDETGIMIDIKQSWDSYQRLLLTRTETTADGGSQTCIDVYTTPSYGTTTPKLDHTFTVSDELTNYSEGAYLNVYEIDNNPYYVLSYYEKPWAEGIGEDYYPIQREENNYIVKVYDKRYNLVDSIAAPIVKPDEATYRMAAFGFLSDKDLSDGYFTEKGEHAIVVSYYDMTIESDEYVYTFDVYNTAGEKISSVIENAYGASWLSLSPVAGQEDQMAFLKLSDDAQTVEIVNLPSCEPALTIPANVDGNGISFDLDRIAKGDSYLYGIKKSTADDDEDGNVIASILWYTPELKLDHTTKFNLGPNGEYFTPLLNQQTMSPYLFDSDDELEYVYIAKKKRTDSDAIDNVLEIAKEDGTILRSFRGDDSNSLMSPAVVAMSSTKNQLHIAYYNSSTGDYTIDFYDLPFSALDNGGDGTADNPYIIKTAGDMLQIANHTTSYFKLADNIDMRLLNSGWTPVEYFTGQIDGDGYAIYNLNIESQESQSGLFQQLGENAEIKNLTIADAHLSVTANNYYAGLIAGEALGAKFNNVHIVNAEISAADDSASPNVGGFVGKATVYSEANDCSFSGTISVGGASGVGGIFGSTNTSSNATACAVSGTLTAKSSLGGIVGETSTGCMVTDSHVSATLTAENTIGGIVGSNDSRGAITRCVAEGSISATAAPRWGGWSVGGIVGLLASDWASSSTIVMQGNVADIDITIPSDATDDETIHRIAGFTIVNEEYYDGETPKVEAGIADNYAASDMTVCGNVVSSTDATSTEGASKQLSDMDQSFFTGLGYAFGTSTESPWAEGSPLPTLYYETASKAITFLEKNLTAEKGAELSTTATVYDGSADALTIAVADPTVATAEISSVSGSVAVITITALNEGTTTLTLSDGSLTSTATLTVKPATASAITAPASASFTLQFNGRSIVANAARSIEVYSIDGQRVAQSATSSLSLGSLSRGVYIVRATDAAGHSATRKIVVE